MYNVFRYSGAYAEAAYIRELFDEPTAALYQIHALIRALDEATRPGSEIAVASVVEQLDETIVSVVDLIDGKEEREFVRNLLDLRTAISSGDPATLRRGRSSDHRRRPVRRRRWWRAPRCPRSRWDRSAAGWR